MYEPCIYPIKLQLHTKASSSFDLLYIYIYTKIYVYAGNCRYLLDLLI